MAAVAEKVEGLQSSLHHKLDKAALQGAKHEVQEARQQGQATAQALTDLQHSLRQQGQGHAASLHRLEALIATCAQGMHRPPSTSPFRSPLVFMHELVTSRRDKTKEVYALRHHKQTQQRPEAGQDSCTCCAGVLHACRMSAGCGHVCQTPANSCDGSGVCELQ